MQYLLTNIWDHRAMNAYFRDAERGGYEAAIPTSPDTYIEAESSRHYVVLHNRSNMLAVYRVRHDDRLVRLKRIPDSLSRLYN